MRFSLEFIKEFCDPGISPRELAERLTLAGMEVGAIEQVGRDWAFEIEVTANRYDWLSIIGISREVAAVCGCQVKVCPPSQEKEEPLKEIKIVIEDESDCPVYIGRYIKKVKVGESPQWLKDRLSACGMSTVNNVVDVTNYCMLKWGNPLHAFDADKIEGAVRVRRAKDREQFIGLDGKERNLTRENLVIADDKKVIALAGVMGSSNTEVDEKTKNVLLEAALFSPLTVRRSRRSAGIETDSSYRFERRVLPEYVDLASRAAQERIMELAGGTKGGTGVCGAVPEIERPVIEIDMGHFRSYVGHNISAEEAEKILTHLGFSVEKKNPGRMEITAPLFRLDIQREVDIYEEITRIYGYARINPVLPALLRVPEKGFYDFKKGLRDFLVSLGLREMISFSITSDEVLKRIEIDKFLSLSNPLRSQENAMRPTLLSGALDAVRHNLNQKANGLKFFELASIYQDEAGACRETPVLSLTISGPSLSAAYLKGLVQECLSFLNLSGYEWADAESHAFSEAIKVISRGNILGIMGKVSRKVCDAWDIKQDLFFFEADLGLWHSLRQEKKYRPFSRYPFVFRDISLALGRDVRFREIEKIVRENGAPFCTGIELVDIYQGKKLSSGEKGLTVRVFYQAEDKTLTSQEVDDLHSSVRSALSGAAGMTLR